MKFCTLITATLVGAMPVATAVQAMELPAGAVQTATTSEPLASVAVPVGPFSQGTVETVSVEGSVSSRAWKITDSNLTTLQLIAPLRDQLVGQGFSIVLDCDVDQCGGFDFRYELDLLPEPEMHVDLGDFRFLTARLQAPGNDPEFVSLMVSRSANTGFLQMTRVGAPEKTDGAVVASTKSSQAEIAPQPEPLDTLASQLLARGRAPLDDLIFETGSSRLGEGEFGSMAELSQFLKSDPDISIALVGHTDAEGALVSNLSLSKKRAASVLQRLVSDYGVPRHQLEAAGVGYLAPRASNQTEGGRTQNRRVEVILTSTR